MRSKEESHDYRYFPDPDLPPLVLAPADIERMRGALPELPAIKAERFARQYQLRPYDIEVLIADARIADFFEATVAIAQDARIVSNWMMGDVLSALNARSVSIHDLRLTPAGLAALIELVQTGAVSLPAAKRVFITMLDTGRSAPEIVADEGLTQVSDDAQIAAWAEQVIGEHAALAERYRAGDQKVLGFMMGELMKRSKGQADPKVASEVLRKLLV